MQLTPETSNIARYLASSEIIDFEKFQLDFAIKDLNLMKKWACTG